MINFYRHIFFDLDHTLWDFDKNSAEVLAHLYAHYNLHTNTLFTLRQFIDKFRDVNQRLWDLYNIGRITKDKIRSARFPIIFAELGAADLAPEDIAEMYLQMCPLRTHIMPYTLETLRYLKQKYALHIITNGFEDVQQVKLKSAGLREFFDRIITSESCGYKKPDANIFRYAVQAAGGCETECLMIGDNYEADVKGALSAGMDAIFYNPYKVRNNEVKVREINCLSELVKIL